MMHKLVKNMHDFSWVNIDYGQPSLEPWMKQFNRTFHTFYTVFIKIHKMTHLVSSKSMTILFDLLHVNGPPIGSGRHCIVTVNQIVTVTLH